MQGVNKSWPGGEICIVQTSDVLRISVFPKPGRATRQPIKVRLTELVETAQDGKCLEFEWPDGRLIIGMIDGRLCLLIYPKDGQETPNTLVVLKEELKSLN